MIQHFPCHTKPQKTMNTQMVIATKSVGIILLIANKSFNLFRKGVIQNWIITHLN